MWGEECGTATATFRGDEKFKHETVDGVGEISDAHNVTQFLRFLWSPARRISDVEQPRKHKPVWSIQSNPKISRYVCRHLASSSKQVATCDYNLKGGSNTQVNNWLCRLSTSHSRNHLNEAEPAVWQGAT